MALALDASSPSAVQSTVAASVTTASFSIPAGSLLVAHFAYDTVAQVGGAVVTMTDNTGGQLTWSLVQQADNSHNNPGLSTSGGVYVARAYSAASRTLTVTATKTVETTVGCWMRVTVITGADSASPIGNINATTDNSGTFSQSVTTSRANSWVWCGICDWGAGASPTAGTGCTTDSGNLVSGHITGSVVRRTSTQPTSGTAEIVSNTAPTSTDWNLVAYEIKEAADAGGGWWFTGTPQQVNPPVLGYWDAGALSFETFTLSTVDSTTPAEAAVGSKSSATDTVDSSSTSDRPTGSKSVTWSSVDSTTPADRPAGAKAFSKLAVDSTTVADRPVGSKGAVRTSIEAPSTSDRPAGFKAATGATSSSVSATDRASSVETKTGATSTAVAGSDRPAGAKSSVRASTTSTVVIDRPAGQKRASGLLGTSVVPADRAAGIRRASAGTVTTTSVLDRATGVKIVSGVTRTAIAPFELIVSFEGSGIEPRDVTVEMRLVDRMTLKLIERVSSELDMNSVRANLISRLGLIIVESIHTGPPEV